MALPATQGDVDVVVDSLAQPHAMVSGKVTFSDGKRATWYVDQMGRLGLDPEEEGLSPQPRRHRRLSDEASASIKVARLLTRGQGIAAPGRAKSRKSPTQRPLPTNAGFRCPKTHPRSEGRRASSRDQHASAP